jgi:hypothetical protein
MPPTYPRIEFPVALDALGLALDEVERDARDLVDGAGQAAFTWRPRPEAWSVGECLAHLTATLDAYLPAIARGLARTRSAAPDGPPLIAPGALSRWFIREMEPPVRRRFRAPRAARPEPALQPGPTWRAFRAANDELRGMLADCRRVDVNRIRFPNPFVKGLRFTVGTGLVLMVVHHRRHVWQAFQVAEAAGCPGRIGDSRCRPASES